MNEKAQFKLALRTYLNIHSFYSVDEFLMFKNDSQSFDILHSTHPKYHHCNAVMLKYFPHSHIVFLGACNYASIQSISEAKH
jgi:hypothetical protein